MLPERNSCRNGYRNRPAVELYSPVVRRSAILLPLFLLVTTLPILSQEERGLYGQIGSVGGIGIFGRYISLEAGLGWQSGGFTVAGVPRLIAGTSQFDVHLAPQVLVQTGLFYLQTGWIFELIDHTTSYQVVDTGPTAGFGVRTPLLELSGGTLVLDTGYEVFLALEPDQEIPPANNIVPSNALDGLLDFAVTVSAVFSLLRLGLIYTLGP